MTEEEVLQTVAAAGRRLADELRAEPARERVFAAIDRCLEELATTGLWGQANRLPSGKLWEAAGQLLQHGALLHRARFKPRGYAGDDEMLRRICENWRCDHPLGRLLDDYFQSHAAPKAVRNRTALVADAVLAEMSQSAMAEFRVTSIGSGPAIDLLSAAERLNPADRARLHVTLLDLDPQALHDAQRRLEVCLPKENITAARENLYRLAARAEAQPLLAADLVACTGFFDYLNQDDATALLRRLWAELHPGGRLLVFNFAPHNPSRALMEWIGNWYLVYRDEAAMRELAQAAGIPPHRYRMSAEAEGIDLYIDARRAGSRAVG